MRPSSVLLAASGWIALAATSMLPALSPLRAVSAVLFIAICPGVAAVRLASETRTERAAHREPMLTAALVVGSSLALATLAAESLFLARCFTAQRCVIVLSLLTDVMVLISERGARRRRPA